jgi:pilus assembly protein Flp/PilA
MNSIQWVKRFLREEDGPTAVEYAVMLALFVLVCVTAIERLDHRMFHRFDDVSAHGLGGQHTRH